MHRQTRTDGYSLLELIFVLGTLTTLAGIAMPQVLGMIDDYRTAGATRYVSSRIQRTRMEAVSRSSRVAMQFVPHGQGYSFGVYLDGNGDGIRSEDIRNAIDPSIAAVDRLADHFSGVEFGVLAGLPPVEAAGAAPGSDPIKLGASNLLSYSPAGTSTSGSIYVRGRGHAQYVIRVFGDTGRTRILKFNRRTREWRPL
jgi:type II secretory pathway pseudopilin PulG